MNPIKLPLIGHGGGAVPCRVTIYAEGAKLTLLGNQRTEASQALESQVISFQTDKDLNAPTGTFSVTLHNIPVEAPGRFQGLYLADFLRPMDMVVISFARLDDHHKLQKDVRRVVGLDHAFTAAMVGFIGQKPTESEMVNEEGGVTQTLTITGFDMGKLLLNAQLYYFREVPHADLKTFASRGYLGLQEGPGLFGAKHDVAKFALERFFYDMTRLSFQQAPDGTVDVRRALGYALQKMHVIGGKPAVISTPANFYSQEQNVHAFLDNLAEKPWGELFVDSWPDADEFAAAMLSGQLGAGSNDPAAFDGTRNFICMREVPFKRDRWEALPAFEIQDDVIHQVSIGGEPTLYNVFYARASALGAWNDIANATLTPVPIVRLDSVKKFGYRPLIAASNVIPFTDGTNYKGLEDIARALTEDLYTCHAASDEFFSGTIQIQGTPLPRVGCRLVRHYSARMSRYGGRKKAMEFYIEGVGHQWNVFGTCHTSLRVTRGLEVGDHARRFPPIPPRPASEAEKTTFPQRKKS